MVRLKDIASKAAVSLMTVSKALRDAPDVSAATTARIKALAQTMGYVPDPTARGLRTRKTRMLGIILSTTTNPVFSRILLALESRAQELGFEVLLACTQNQPEREELCIRRLLARRVDGLFLSPVYRMGNDSGVYRDLLTSGVPVVLLGHSAPFCSRFVNVESDDIAGGYAGTKHLLSLGHTRIAFLSGPPAAPWSEERFEGYRRALREFNLDVDDKLVFQAGRSIEDGAKAAEQILNERTGATAIQAVNDLVATGCADAFLRNGIAIPSEMSVAGFGNILFSEYARVPLTTVSQPKYRLGLAAMEMMQVFLRGQRPESRRLPADLVIRGSTGIAPASPVDRRP